MYGDARTLDIEVRKTIVDVWVRCVLPRSVGKNSKRAFVGKDGRAFVAPGKGAGETKETLAGLLVALRPKEVIRCPVEVALVAVWPWPASAPKRLRESLDWKLTKPDADNLMAGFLDVMTSLGFWADDGLVVRQSSTKLCGRDPGFRLTVREAGRVWGTP